MRFKQHKLEYCQATSIGLLFALVFFAFLPSSVFALHTSTITLNNPSLSCSGSNSQVHLSWSVTNLHGNNSFFVERKLVADAVYAQVAGPLSGTSHINVVSSGTAFNYRIRGEEGGTINYSNVVTVTSGYCGSVISSTVASCAVDGPRITVNWAAASGLVGHYEIERRKTGEPAFVFLANTGLITSYTDGPSIEGTQEYQYRIKTVWQNNTSRTSPAAFKKALVCPVALTASSECLNVDPGGPRMNLSWNSLLGVQEYQVYRKLPGDSSYSLLQGGLTGTIYVDDLAESYSAGYFNTGSILYFVRAVWPNAEQADSSAGTIAIPQCAPFLEVIGSCEESNVGFQLVWSATQSANHYNVLRGGTFIKQVFAPGVSWLDLSSSPATNTYRIEASSGVTTLLSNEVVKSIDCSVVAPPEPPVLEPLQAFCSAGDSRIQLQWSASNNVISYTIYRTSSAGTDIFSFPATTTSWSDPGVESGFAYSYFVRAVGFGGTADSQVRTATAQSCATPSKPIVTLGTSCVLGNPQVNVSWTSTTNTVNYKVHRTPSVLNPVHTTANNFVTSWADTTVLETTPYEYRVEAVGLDGVPTTTSDPVSITSTSCVPETPIITVSNQCTAGVSEIKVDWTSSGTNTDHYELFRDGILLPPNEFAPGSRTDDSVVPSVSYIYRVDAVGPMGSLASSEDKSIVAIDCVPAGPFTLLVDQPPYCSGSYLRANLSWTSSSNANSYNLYRNRVAPVQTVITLSVTSPFSDLGLGRSLDFDGVNDRVAMADSASLDLTNNFTLEAWVYPTGNGSGGANGGVILSKENRYVLSRFGDGTIRWSFRNSNPGWTSLNTWVTVPLNKWTHIVITYSSGAQIKTYKNGVLAHTYNGAGSIPVGAEALWIGGRSGGSQHFDGNIDDVRIYRRTLTGSEVADHFAGAYSSESGLSGIWHFDEGSAVQTASDSSNNGNNGTLGIGAAADAGDPAWSDAGMQYSQNYNWQAEAISAGGNTFATPNPTSSLSAPMCVPPKPGVVLGSSCDAVVGGPVVTIAWSYSINAVRYDVYREMGAVDALIGSVSQTANAALRSVTDNNGGLGLVQLTPYSYYVIARRSAGALSDTQSDTIPITTPTCLTPTPPVGVQAVFECVGSLPQARVTWADSNFTDYYTVYRNGIALSPTVLDTNPLFPNATTYSFMNTGIAVGTSYVYSVAAFGPGGRSPGPDPAFTLNPANHSDGNYCKPPTPVLASPTTACVASASVNTLSWSGDTVAGNTARYEIYRNTVNTVPVAHLTTTTTTTWQDDGSISPLNPSQTYYYWIKAIGAGPTTLTGNLSSSASVQTLACNSSVGIPVISLANNACFQGQRQIQIDWSSTASALAYDVYRSGGASATYHTRFHPFDDTGSYALDFDGVSGFVDIPDQNFFSPSVNDLTISMWAKVPVSAPAIGNGACGGAGSYLIAKQGASDWEWTFENDRNTALCFSLWRLNGQSHANVPRARTVNDGLWHHYAATIDYLANLSLYVDGVLVGSRTTFAGTMGNGIQPLQIGKRGTGDYFTGQVDDVQVYSRVLTNAEIQNLVNKVSISPSGLAGVWHFDEGVGSLTKDDSQSGNTGSISGPSAWVQLSATNPTYVSGSLQDGQAYSYWVRAKGVSGESANSNVLSVPAITCVPGDPNLTIGLDCSTGNSALKLEWDADSNTSYWEIYKKRKQSALDACIPEDYKFSFNTPQTSHIDSNVQSPGITYLYCAQGFGPGGTGPFSLQVEATTASCVGLPFGGVPADMNPTVSAGCSGSVPKMTLDWDEDATGNTISFGVYRKKEGESSFGFVTSRTSTQTSYSDVSAALQAGISYVYRIDAIGNTGITVSSEMSPIEALDCANILPLPPGLCNGNPALPGLCPFVISRGNTRSVSLSWTDSSNEYDDPDLLNKAGYRLLRDGSPIALITSLRGGDDLYYSYVDDTVEDDHSYTYYVSAYNAVTDPFAPPPYGSPSDAGGVLSNSLPVTVPTASPGNFTLSGAVETGPQVRLNWTEAATTVAAGPVTYEVIRSNTADFVAQTSVIGCESITTPRECLDLAPDPGETYYKVVATNLGGFSETPPERYIVAIFPGFWREISPF